MTPEKGSIRGVARATGHDKDTICRGLRLQGPILKKLHLTSLKI